MISNRRKSVESTMHNNTTVHSIELFGFLLHLGEEADLVNKINRLAEKFQKNTITVVSTLDNM